MFPLLDFFFSRDERLQVAKKKLLESHSFSLPSSASIDRFIQLKQYYRISKLLFKSKQHSDKEYAGNAFLYTVNSSNLELEIDLVASNSKDVIGGVFLKEEMFQGVSLFQKSYLFLLLSFYALVFFPFSFFSKKNRINLALIPEHFLGILIFIDQIKQGGFKTVYMYCTHEPEVSLLSHYLMKNKVYVSLIPNANPLFMFNKVLIGDKVILTLSYQRFEMEAFNTLPFEKWQLPKLAHHCKSASEAKLETTNKIYYYSHASWVRKSEGHNIPYFNEIEMEIKALESFALMDLDFDIQICLHPKEKSKSQEDLVAYYSTYFGDSFSFYEGNSYDSFEGDSLGIGAFSSILFERIECGFKTIFIMDHIEGLFPVSNSNFDYFLKKPNEIDSNSMTKWIDISALDFFRDKDNYTHFE